MNRTINLVGISFLQTTIFGVLLYISERTGLFMIYVDFYNRSVITHGETALFLFILEFTGILITNYLFDKKYNIYGGDVEE